MRRRPLPEEIRVQLTLLGFARDPNELTALTGVMPSKSWRVGDLIERSSRKYESNGWRVSAEAPVTEIEAGVDELIDRLSPCWDVLRDLSAECRVELSVVIYADAGVPAIHLRADQIRRVSELSSKLDVDVYCLPKE